MIDVMTEEMHGSNWVSDLKLITSGPWLVWQNLQRERNGALFLSARSSMPKKCLTPPTLSEMRLLA